jgi:hypothetical protein
VSFFGLNFINDLIFSLLKVVEEVSKNPVPEFRRSLVFEVITQNDQDEDVEVEEV